MKAYIMGRIMSHEVRRNGSGRRSQNVRSLKNLRHNFKPFGRGRKKTRGGEGNAEFWAGTRSVGTLCCFLSRNFPSSETETCRG